MTHPDDEYGEFLRRVLHAEADAVRPGTDGLDLIRERINERPPWSISAFVETAPVRLRSLLVPLADLRAKRSLFAGSTWLGNAWARTMIAVGAALIAVALAVSAPNTLERITSAGQKGSSGGADQGTTTSVTEGSQWGTGAPTSPPASSPAATQPGLPVPPVSPLPTGPAGCRTPAPAATTPANAAAPRTLPIPSCPPDATPTPTSSATPAPADPTEAPPTPQPAPEPIDSTTGSGASAPEPPA